MSNPHVRWTGRARTPDQCVPCGTCGSTINEPCTNKVFPLPHLARADYAEVLGFVAVAAPGGLFEERP